MKAVQAEGAANMNGDALHALPKASAGTRIDGFRIPKRVSTWRILRLGHHTENGTRETQRLGYGTEPNGLTVTEWPIAEFNLREIAARWGVGDYRVQWIEYIEDRPVSRGLTPDFRIGNPSGAEVGDAAPPLASSAAPPEKAGRFCNACGGAQAPDARFCSHCGRSAVPGAVAAPAPAVMQGPAADAVAFAMAIHKAYEQGGANTLALIGQISAQVTAEADARARRYEADAAARMQAEKLAHERELARMNAQAGQGQLRAGDVKRVVAEVVKEELGEVHDRLDDLEGDDDEPAQPSTQPEPGSLKEKADVAGMVLDKAAPIVGDIAGRVIDALAKRGTSGGAAA